MPRLISGPDQAGKFCPHCQQGIISGVPVQVCDACNAAQHAECWDTRGGCATPGCPQSAAARQSAAQIAGAAAMSTPGYGQQPPGYGQSPPPGYGFQPPPGAPGSGFGRAYPAGRYQPTAAELGGWNWGAFVFNWIWGLNHRCYWPLLTFIPYVGLVVAIVCGIKGNQWAWESGRFATIAEMRACEDVWKKWALIWFICWIVIAFIVFIVALLASNGSSGY